MSRVFKKRSVRPIPEGAVIATKRSGRVARWTDGNGKKHEAPIIERDGADHIVIESEVFYCRYRTADHIVRERSTGCRTQDGAMRVLAEFEARQEKIRSGVLSAHECAIADHSRKPISEHIEAYLEHLRANGCTERHIKERRAQLGRIVTECGFARVRDLAAGAFEKWLVLSAGAGMGARNRNVHRSALVAFSTWLVMTRRLTSNPFESIPAANERADRRRVRRAMSIDELERLIEAAKARPLREALHGNRGEGPATLKDTTAARLMALGATRALAYKVMALTGLRFGELRSIHVSQVHLDHEPAFIELRAADEKARRGARIPLPCELAAELAVYIDRTRRSRNTGHPTRSNVLKFGPVHDDPLLFDLPKKMTRVFDRDLIAAGLATMDKDGHTVKKDARGRTLDIHALRHTFGTLLAKAGVPLQLVQSAMRHSTPALTMRHYVHLDLGDLAGAVSNLPSLSGQEEESAAVYAGARNLPPNPPPDPPLMAGKSIQISANSCKSGIGKQDGDRPHSYEQKNAETLGKPNVFRGIEASKEWWAVQDSNLRPPACKAGALTD